jgi:hypothetical protein
LVEIWVLMSPVAAAVVSEVVRDELAATSVVEPVVPVALVVELEVLGVVLSKLALLLVVSFEAVALSLAFEVEPLALNEPLVLALPAPLRLPEAVVELEGVAEDEVSFEATVEELDGVVLVLLLEVVGLLLVADVSFEAVVFAAVVVLFWSLELEVLGVVLLGVALEDEFAEL